MPGQQARSPYLCAGLQSAKLQALYNQTQSALEESDARVKELSSALETAQQEAERLRRDMRNLQVRPGAWWQA